jgi:anti-sigma-K factor RskA
MTGQGFPTGLSEEDILVAGEFVLGLLDSDEQKKAEIRANSEPAFAAEIAAWEDRLRPLLLRADETPPAQLLDTIHARLPANANTPVTDRGDADSVRWWQGIAGAAIAASLVMAVMLFNTGGPVPVPDPVTNPVMVAAMAAKSGPQAMTARYDPAQGELLITPVALDTKNLYPELWIINAAGEARSLGILPQDRSSRIIVTPDLRNRMIAGATLAVTAEPAGGAPGGKATGPVVVIGEMRTL